MWESSQSKARAGVLEPSVSMLLDSHLNCELGGENQLGNAFANFFESPLGYQLTLVSQETVKYYAVARGVCLGTYWSWAECKLQVNKFNGARDESFVSLSENEHLLHSRSVESKCIGWTATVVTSHP